MYLHRHYPDGVRPRPWRHVHQTYTGRYPKDQRSRNHNKYRLKTHVGAQYKLIGYYFMDGESTN
jgi:hypothetical protein